MISLRNGPATKPLKSSQSLHVSEFIMERKQNIFSYWPHLLAVAIVIFAVFAIQRTIKNEGRKSREALEKTADELVDKSVDKIWDRTKNLPSDAIEGAKSSGEKIVDEVGDVLGGISDSIFGNESNDSSESKLQPEQILKNVIGAGNKITKVLDNELENLIALSIPEEIELGKQISRQVQQTFAVRQLNRNEEARFKKLARPFLANANREGIEYQFYVIENEAINAFSTLGGHIYLNQGLLDSVETDGELQFVIGHEIAHVDLRHCAQQMTYVARASNMGGDTLGNVVAIAYKTIALGYSEEKEHESDEFAFEFMTENRSEAFDFLTKLAQIEILQPKSNGSILNATVQELDKHFRSHPQTRSRIERLKRKGLDE